MMHLRQESVSIAGGIVLFLIALKMIFPSPEGMFGEALEGEPFIVPMAIPFVAGPSGMASVMLLGSQEPARMGDWSLALFIAWLATAVILFSATYLYKVLGKPVLIALERLMGMLLVAISVQMLMDGVATYLKVPGAACINGFSDFVTDIRLSWTPGSMLKFRHCLGSFATGAGQYVANFSISG